MFSRKLQTIPDYACSGMATFASSAATNAADGGILPLTMQNVMHPRSLMVFSLWEPVDRHTMSKIFTVSVRLKECVKRSRRVQFAWDSGSVAVMVSNTLTRLQDGIQCPGSTWRRFRPRSVRQFNFYEVSKQVAVFYATVLFRLINWFSTIPNM